MYAANPTFAENYCVKHGIAPERFAGDVLRRTLYLHARLLQPLVRLCRPNHFVSDRDLVRAAGGLRRVSDLADEIEDYNRRPANCGFWRVALRVRVSTHRLRALMHATLPRVQDRELPPAPYKDYPRPVSKLPDHQPTGRAGAARRLAPLPLP